MYIESNSGMAGGESRCIDSRNRLEELVSDIENTVNRILSHTKVFSVFHVRAAVVAVAREYREFQVWAGDMHGRNTFVVTIWANWVGDNEKDIHHVPFTLSEGTKMS